MTDQPDFRGYDTAGLAGSQFDYRSYAPPGPIGAAFMACLAFITAIMGPLGSGKTGAALMRILNFAKRQLPHPRNNTRSTRWLVVRDTYRNLDKTTIPSWKRWVPEGEAFGSFWKGGNGKPAINTLEWMLPDGTLVDCVIEFVGIEDGDAETNMPGLEITGAYLNEADKLSKSTLDYISGRVGRWPPRDNPWGFPGATWRGVWMDFNAPDKDHWLREFLVDNPPTDEDLQKLGVELEGQPGVRFFEQPAGMLYDKQTGRYRLNPGAENLHNLVKGYYPQQLIGKPKWMINTQVLNKWGASRIGMPVYNDEYNEEIHRADAPLQPILGLPLSIGLDAGLDGSATIGQTMPNGQERVLDEIVPPPGGWGAKRFGKALRKMLLEKYRPWAEGTGGINDPMIPPVMGWCDPAGNSRVGTDEQTWVEIMRSTAKIPISLAPTNAQTARQEAVREPLERLIDGEPGYLISTTCRMLLQGYASKYRWPKRKPKSASEGDLITMTPDKNEWSHVCEAEQYRCLGVNGIPDTALQKAPANSAVKHQTHAIEEEGDEHEREIYRRMRQASFGEQTHAIED
jgi:hypothetical protein